MTNPADEQFPAGDSGDGRAGEQPRRPSRKAKETDGAHEGAAGIARRIDHLGRVVIPAEYRKVFGIENGDLVDMTLEGNGVVLRKLEQSCVFCRSLDDLGMFKGKLLCAACHEMLRQ
jgi:AbrB family transcriptional regulator, transcriptional pleiotropic regulator of transition state genes